VVRPEDIGVSTQTTAFGASEARAGLRLTSSRYFTREVPLHYVERTVKSEIWRLLYGDLERAVDEARREALMSLMSSSDTYSNGERLNAAFNKLAALVRNPF
jgi:hypothetical protein